MDYKYIEQLMERYWDAETSLEEESILRTFFSQKDIPAEMEHLRALFADEATDAKLGDDFDARILQMMGLAEGEQAQESAPASVKAREVRLTSRLMPLFKAAAVVAIILTLGGALQAPWDNSWNKLEDYAAIQQDIDTVAAVQPIQAENISDTPGADSTAITTVALPKD